MKIFKKLIAVLAAVIMAVSLFAFAGCNKTTESEFMKLAKQDIAALEFNVVYTESNLNESGSIGTEFKINIQSKADSNGNADIALGHSYWGDEESYSYIFLRYWKIYVYNNWEDKEHVTEITNSEDLYGVIDISEIINTFKLNLSDAVNMVNSFILNIAEKFNAVTETEGKLTADLGKVFSNAIKELKPVVDDLKDETTVGDILKNNVIKKIVSPITNIIKPTTIIDAVKQALTYLDDESKAVVEKILELFNDVKPERNSTTYDYLVKLLDSQKTVDFINSMIGSGVGITKKLSDFTLKEIFDFIGSDIDVKGIKQKVEELLAKVELKENSVEGNVFYFKNVKVEYLYEGDYNLVSQTFSGNICTKGSENSDGTIFDINGKIDFKKEGYKDSDLIKLPDKLPEIK